MSYPVRYLHLKVEKHKNISRIRITRRTYSQWSYHYNLIIYYLFFIICFTFHSLLFIVHILCAKGPYSRVKCDFAWKEHKSKQKGVCVHGCEDVLRVRVFICAWHLCFQKAPERAERSKCGLWERTHNPSTLHFHETMPWISNQVFLVSWSLPSVLIHMV